MWFTSLLPSLKRSSGRYQEGQLRRQKTHRNAAPHRQSFVPRLEILEDRTVLSTLTVLNTLDSGAGSLRDTIASASSGDTIVFDPSLDGQTITLISGQLAITKSLDIEGPPDIPNRFPPSQLTIGGNAASRVFAVSGGVTLTLAWLTIANGLADQGGGIDNAGSLTLSHDVLSGNEALGDSTTTGLGGGVFNEAGASLSVTHCSFTNNQVVGSSLGLGFGGGLMNDGTATVSASTFTGNQATGGTPNYGAGGGISNQNNATLTVSNTTFTNNLATNGPSSLAAGGAIDNEAGGSLTVTNSTFTGNQALSNAAGGFGGAIENFQASLSVSDSKFFINLASGFSSAIGGAIDSAGPATITNSTLNANHAIGSGPGALAFGGAIDNQFFTSSTSMTVTNCELTGNEAHGGAGGDGITTFGFGQGGAIDSGGNLSLLNSTINENLAIGGALAPGAPTSFSTASDGGGIDLLPPPVTGITLTVTNCTLIENLVVGGNILAGGAGGAGGGALGGGIELSFGATGIITNCFLFGNEALGGAGGSGAAGGPGAGGGIEVSLNSTATISGTTLRGNVASGGDGGSGANGGAGVGGGISVGSAVLFGLADSSSITIAGSTLIYNSAAGGNGGPGGNGGNGLGGGVYVASGTACIDHTSITGNQALGGFAGSGGTAGQGVGGGIYITSGAKVAIVHSHVVGNHASTSDDDVFGVFSPTC